MSPAKPVNIHTASEAELRTLHGVGAARAQQIISLRAQVQLTPEVLALALRTSTEMWERLVRDGHLSFEVLGACGFSRAPGAPGKGRSYHPERTMQSEAKVRDRHPLPGSSANGDTQQPQTQTCDKPTTVKQVCETRVDSEPPRSQVTQSCNNVETGVAHSQVERPSERQPSGDPMSPTVDAHYDRSLADDMVTLLQNQINEVANKLQQVRIGMSSAADDDEATFLHMRANRLHLQMTHMLREHHTWRTHLQHADEEADVMRKNEFWSMTQSSTERYIDNAHRRIVETPIGQTADPRIEVIAGSSGNPQPTGKATEEDGFVSSTPRAQGHGKSMPQVSPEDISAVVNVLPANNVFRPSRQEYLEESLQFEDAEETDGPRWRNTESKKPEQRKSDVFPPRQRRFPEKKEPKKISSCNRNKPPQTGVRFASEAEMQQFPLNVPQTFEFQYVNAEPLEDPQAGNFYDYNDKAQEVRVQDYPPTYASRNSMWESGYDRCSRKLTSNGNANSVPRNPAPRPNAVPRYHTPVPNPVHFTPGNRSGRNQTPFGFMDGNDADVPTPFLNFGDPRHPSQAYSEYHSRDSRSRQTSRAKQKKPRRRSSSSDSSDSESEEDSDDSSSESSEDSSSEEERGRPRRSQKKNSRRKSPNAPHMQLFKGGVNEWENFIFYFKNMARQYKWKKKKKLQRLLECLRDKAVEYVSTLSRSTVKSYSKLLKALSKRYGSDVQPHVLRKNLMELRQEANESLDEFADRIQQVAQRAFKETGRKTTNLLGVEAFLKGICDKTSSKHAAHKKPKDIRKALELVKAAAAIESFIGRPTSSTRMVTFEEDAYVRQGRVSDREILGTSQPRRYTSPGPSRSNEQRSRTPESDRGFSGYDSQNGSRNDRQQSPARPRDGRCYNCHETGHFRINCPYPPHRPRGQGSPQRFNRRQEIATSPMRFDYGKRYGNSRSPSPGRGTQTESHFFSRDKRVFQGSSLNTPGWTMTVTIGLNGHQVEAIVDTASQVTLIGMKTAQRLGLSLDEDSPVKIHGIGENMEMKAKIVRDIDLSLNEDTWKWDIIVGPARELCILGIDFLHHVGAIIDLKNPCVRINDAVIPAQIRAKSPSAQFPPSYHESVSSKLVSTLADWELPPFSGRIIHCRLAQLIEPVPLTSTEGPIHDPEFLSVANRMEELHPFNLSVEDITLEKKNFVEADENGGINFMEDWNVESCPNVEENLPNSSVTEVSELLGSQGELKKFPGVRSTKPEMLVYEEPPDNPGYHVPKLDHGSLNFRLGRKAKLGDLLVEFQDIFATHHVNPGEFSALTLKFKFEGFRPRKHSPWKTPFRYPDAEEDFIFPDIRCLPAGGPHHLLRWARPPIRFRDYVP